MHLAATARAAPALVPPCRRPPLSPPPRLVCASVGARTSCSRQCARPLSHSRGKHALSVRSALRPQERAAAGDAGEGSSSGGGNGGGSGGRSKGKPLAPNLASVDEDAAADMSGGLPPPSNLMDRDDYKEDSRKHFRTVFDFDRWAAHRSTRRYARHVLGMPKSRIVRSLAAPLLYVAGLTTALGLYHTAAEAGLVPDASLALPSEPFGLTSFALSLLLVFRTDASYSRWRDARKNWDMIVSRSRELVRQGITYVPEDQAALLGLLCRWTVAFSQSLVCDLRADVDAEVELQRVLLPEEAASVLAARNRPSYCLQVLSEAIKSVRLPEAAGSSSSVAYRMDENITAFQEAMASCERILRTPIPLSYTRHTSRFMMIWLTLLPFSLWGSCRWAMVPLWCTIAFLLLGIEELGVTIEEPFSILPLEQLCDLLERNIWELEAMHASKSSHASSSRDGVLTATGVVQAALLSQQQQAQYEQQQQQQQQQQPQRGR